ncbi:hypothetical protein DH2020_038502 [Rehmannia glutinosa]|uniref:Serine aminopeptidase S33 domain-containing protein n=1 Tax=Rehmannia glutinosa TaxID=99300 RepID=A0ABR0UYH3_REHGL
MANRANDAATVMLTSGASGRIDALFDLRVLRSLWRLISAFFLIFLLPFHGRRRCMALAPESAEKCGGGGGKEEKTSAATGKVVRVPAAMVPRKSAVDKEVAARRAVAARRVAEDNAGDDEENKDVLRDYWLFVTSRGDTMFTQSWTPAKLQIRGVVVLLHGLNEHRSVCYNDMVEVMGCTRTFLSLDYAVNDMAVLDPKVQQRVAGIVLTSPAVGVQPSHPILAVRTSLSKVFPCHEPPILAPVFSLLLPRFQFSAANKQGIVVSRDPKALVAKYSDPLVFTGSIRVRTGYEILRITAHLQQNLNRLTLPFFVLHGTADSITDPEGSRKLHEEACSADKTIKLYRGLLHDLLFEPEKEEVTQTAAPAFQVRFNFVVPGCNAPGVKPSAPPASKISSAGAQSRGVVCAAPHAHSKLAHSPTGLKINGPQSRVRPIPPVRVGFGAPGPIS